MSGAAPTDERYIVPGLSRGLAMLEAFSAERPELSLIDLSRELGVSRSSAFRLAYTLADLGFLVRDDTAKTYRLGPRVLNLGFAYLASQELVEVARPRLESLRDETGCAAHLGVLDGRDVVYLLRIAPNSRLTSNINVGTRLPAYASSMGRAILSFTSPDEVARMYEGVELAAFTDQTATDLPSLRRLLAADRQAGCVVSRAAYEAAIASIAAPLFDASGKPIGAINISAPESSVTQEALDTTLRQAVLDAAGEISRWLGYPGARASA